MMKQTSTVLVVDSNSNTRAMLCDHLQTIQDLNVLEAADGSAALSICLQSMPDMVLLALVLPGLSGRDLLVALKAQGFAGPLIVLVETHQQQAATEAFRLGATDSITKPLREAEVLAAVERGLQALRVRQQRDTLIGQLKTAHQQLEMRTEMLSALYEMGQTVTALPRLDTLFQQVLESLITLTGADYAMLIMFDEASGQLKLQAGRNLPIAMLDRQGNILHDELAEMVISTRETLIADPALLKQFGTARGIYAAVYAPLSVQQTAFGALMVGNHQRRACFTDDDEQLVRGLANYTAMAVLNLRLSQILDQRTRTLKTAYEQFREKDTKRNQHLRAVLASLHQPLVSIESELITIAQQMATGRQSAATSQQLIALSQQVRLLITKVTALAHQKPPVERPESAP